MDLIELIVQILVGLFSGSDAKPQPPRQVQKIPPSREIPAQRPMARPNQQRASPRRNSPGSYPPRPPQPAMRRIIKKIKGPPSIAMRPPPPPLPRVPVPPAPEPIKPVVAKPQAAISATGIRQLILTRRSALRTIYVLSEVIGPPIALRPDHLRSR
jgi:hypothetical protein